jgi:hypothetical protein
MARRTNEVRGRTLKLAPTWSGIFGESTVGNVLLPGENARIPHNLRRVARGRRPIAHGRGTAAGSRRPGDYRSGLFAATLTPRTRHAEADPP